MAHPLDQLTFGTRRRRWLRRRPEPLFGLPYLGEEGGARRWGGDAGGVALHFFGLPPDLDCDPEDGDAIRASYARQLDEAGHGLVEADAIRVADMPAVRVLFKAVMNPQTLRGRIYVASLTLPFRDFSYVIKAQFIEAGMTGMRETVVLNRLLGTGEVELSESGPKGWLCGDGPPHLAVNRSEDAAYDADFPDHPLSRARAIMRELEARATLSDRVARAAPFVYSG